MSYHGDDILHEKHSSQCTGLEAACASIISVTAMTFKRIPCMLFVELKLHPHKSGLSMMTNVTQESNYPCNLCQLI